MLRRNIAQRDDVARLRDGQFRGHRHHRVEIPRALAIRQIAPAIGLPRSISATSPRQRILQQAVLAVDLARFASLGEMVSAPVGV